MRSLIRKRKQGNFLRKISNEERVLLDPNKKLKLLRNLNSSNLQFEEETNIVSSERQQRKRKIYKILGNNKNEMIEK